MLNFKTFLKEELILEAAKSSSVANHDKGKLHELLLSKYLHPDGRLPEHHRSESLNDEHAGTPEQVHNRLQKKIGKDAYNEIDAHAKQTAEAVKKHLNDAGHTGNGNHIGQVFWTSNADSAKKPGDHEKTTGVKDVNSNADLIIRMHDKQGKTTGHVGVSAKYGSNKPNYRNPGLESMEATAGLKSGELKTHADHHQGNMDNLGYTGSADQRNIQYKIDKMGIDKSREEHARLTGLVNTGKKLSKKETIMHEHLGMFIDGHDNLSPKEQSHYTQHAATRAAQAEASGIEAKRLIAHKFTSGMAKKSDEELRNVIRQHVSAPTHIPHIVAHSKVNNDGSANSIVEPSHSIADNHLAHFENLHAAHSTGISSPIKGTDKRTGKVMNVATFTTKNASGPHKGFNGTFSLA